MIWLPKASAVLAIAARPRSSWPTSAARTHGLISWPWAALFPRPCLRAVACSRPGRLVVLDLLLSARGLRDGPPAASAGLAVLLPARRGTFGPVRRLPGRTII